MWDEIVDYALLEHKPTAVPDPEMEATSGQS
jgi:hypothetical protein